MTRSLNNVATRARRKKVFKLAKGFRGRAKNCITISRERTQKAMQYMYRDRRTRKRDMRSLWIQRINAAVRAFGLTYSDFICGLTKLNIIIDRKMLSDMAIREPESFKGLVDNIKANA